MKVDNVFIFITIKQITVEYKLCLDSVLAWHIIDLGRNFPLGPQYFLLYLL